MVRIGSLCNALVSIWLKINTPSIKQNRAYVLATSTRAPRGAAELAFRTSSGVRIQSVPIAVRVRHQTISLLMGRDRQPDSFSPAREARSARCSRQRRVSCRRARFGVTPAWQDGTSLAWKELNAVTLDSLSNSAASPLPRHWSALGYERRNKHDIRLPDGADSSRAKSHGACSHDHALFQFRRTPR